MLQINKKLTVTNYNKRGTKPEWIVLHYTANNGDTAINNCNYFLSDYRGASANYFVDESSIWQCVEDTNTAWHVGNDVYYNGARNTNSIGIEMCSRKHNANSTSLETYYIKDETVYNAVELTAHLMKKYNIPINRVCRHYDVTRKYCPAPMVYNNGGITWGKFIEMVENEYAKQEETLLSKEYDELKALIESNHNAVLGTLADMRKEYTPKIYNTIEEVPSWYREAVQFYIDKNVVQGTGNGLGLTEVKCWTLTVMYRQRQNIL